jgi:hypothetical protein
MNNDMINGDKITITFVKNSAKDGSRYRKRTRTNLKLGKSETAAESTTDGDSSTIARNLSTAVTERASTSKSSCDEECLARSRPRRESKPIKRYEPEEIVLDDESGGSESDSDID